MWRGQTMLSHWGTVRAVCLGALLSVALLPGPAAAAVSSKRKPESPAQRVSGKKPKLAKKLLPAGKKKSVERQAAVKPKVTKAAKATTSSKSTPPALAKRSLAPAREPVVARREEPREPVSRLSPSSTVPVSLSPAARANGWVAAGAAGAVGAAWAAPQVPTSSQHLPMVEGRVVEAPEALARPPELNSSVALVMDQETQQVLLSKNETAVVPIASLTKLMTGLIIADAGLSMDETVRITHDDVDRLRNSSSRMVVGAQLTRGEALHLALMSSENRAAHALARTFPGGEARFVQLMNQKAAQLGMQDTHFVDPTGLSSDNRSSARDLALLVSAAYERPMLRALSTSDSYHLDMGRKTVEYRNTNRLIRDRESDWNIGLQKTGYIREAGRCLVMQVQVAGRQLIMVLLDAAGPAARIGDAERVRRWAESLSGGPRPAT